MIQYQIFEGISEEIERRIKKIATQVCAKSWDKSEILSPCYCTIRIGIFIRNLKYNICVGIRTISMISFGINVHWC